MVAPSDLTVLMSAIKGEKSVKLGVNTGLEVHTFEQKVPIPSYLIAIAVGDLHSRKIGPRSHVWSEKELVEKAAYEFAEVNM